MAMQKKQKIFTGVGIVVGIGVIYFIISHLMYVSTDNAQIEAHTVMMAPKVPGFVTKVTVIEGQKVKAGELLVEIDDRDYQNALKVAQGQLASVEAKRADAERSYRRVSELYSKDAVSRAQFDQASAALNEARATYQALTAGVSQAQLNLESTKIYAPSNGFIARKSVNVGQLASAGVPLLGFVDGQERWVTANFKETDVEDIAVGSKVSVEVDAISGKKFKGSVSSLSPATGAIFALLPPDNATGNFTKVVQRVPVRILLEDLSEAEIEKLRAGLSAVVEVRRH